LGFWDQCLRFAQGILESSPGEPLSSLNLAKTIVLRAEYYNLCQKMDASAHKPSDNSISEETFILFSRYIENSKSALMPYKSDAILYDYNLAEDQIYRWKARAQIAFNNFEDGTTDPGDILNHQHTPGDSAALISHFHRLDLQDPDSDSITRIIKIARTNTRNPIILLQVALAIQDNNPVDAMKSLQSVLEQNPYSKTPSIAFCNVLLAKIALSHEELEVAQVAIENAINIWPDEPEWHALAAQIYNRITNTHEAINHLVEATRLAPKTFSHHMELGKIYFENSNEDPHLLRLALTSFENAIGLEPNEISTLILLAKTQHLLNDLENAQISAQKALMLAPNRADIYQLLSEISICNNDFQGGYEYANKAIQLNPKDLRSIIMLVRSLSSLGRNDEALVKINTVLPMVQEAKYLQLERVNIIRNMNGPRAGLTELKKMLDSDPEDFNILNALAKTYIEVGEADNAVNVAQQALKVCKENSARNDQANLHLLIGQVLRKIGQLDQSIHHLGQAIQLAPDRLEPYLELGLARKERREYDQALQIFEQATSIAPEDPRAPFQAGLALKESKDYKSSETMLRRAVSLAPHDLNIRRQLAAVVALNLVHNPKAGRI
jgi:tetratricopeptide (TPR) repeat protein